MIETNESEGEFAVRLAREAIETWVRERKHLERPKEYPSVFNEKRGVFTTIKTFPDESLRGCIGFPYPEQSLIEGIIDSAISATMDPRFAELRVDELPKIVVEVSILTKPSKIVVSKPAEYLERIKVGRDGLIIRSGFRSGLLLPTVPVEYGWNVEEYLANLCFKAGLPPDAWLDPSTEIYSFQAEVFAEQEPRGKVVRIAGTCESKESELKSSRMSIYHEKG